MHALLIAALVSAAPPPLYNLSLARAVAEENGLSDVDALVARAEKFDDGDRFLVRTELEAAAREEVGLSHRAKAKGYGIAAGLALALGIGLGIGGGVHLATTVPWTTFAPNLNMWPGYIAIGGGGLVAVVGLVLLSVALKYFAAEVSPRSRAVPSSSRPAWSCPSPGDRLWG